MKCKWAWIISSCNSSAACCMVPMGLIPTVGRASLLPGCPWALWGLPPQAAGRWCHPPPVKSQAGWPGGHLDRSTVGRRLRRAGKTAPYSPVCSEPGDAAGSLKNRAHLFYPIQSYFYRSFYNTRLSSLPRTQAWWGFEFSFVLSFFRYD